MGWERERLGSWEREREGIEWKSGWEGERADIDRNGVKRGESGD